MHVCQCHHQCETTDFCTVFFPTVPSMALCVVHGPEISVQQSTCLHMSLTEVQREVCPPVFSLTAMDVSRYLKLRRCIAERRLQSSVKRIHTDMDPRCSSLGLATWDLCNSSQHCLPAGQMSKSGRFI